MTDPTARIREAYDALIAHGRVVEADDDFERWRVGDEWLNDEQLLALAIRLGLVAGPGRVQ